MIQYLKRLFRKLTPLECASRELVEAELAKLEAQTATEYAASITEYNTLRIKRLRAFIAAQTKETV